MVPTTTARLPLTASPMSWTVSGMSNRIDVLSVRGAEVYWQCRTSFSESTIVGSKLEKALGRPVTFRNVTTIRRLADRVAG